MCVIWYLFYNYVPWLVAREPIENISRHNLSNMPPPEWAVHFSINHGAALYYVEKTSLELYVALAALIISGLAVAVFLGKAHGK